MKYYFYIPYFFRMKTRESGRIKVIPFLFTDFLPVMMFIQNFWNIFNLSAFASFFVAFTAMFNFYEIGYIVNDCFTTFRESNPTVRMSLSEINYFNENVLKIFGVRFFIYAISLFFLSIQGMVLNSFCIGCVLLLVVYCAHNYERGKLNVLTNAHLNFAKYLIPFLLIPKEDLFSNISLLVFYVILFPVGRSFFYTILRYEKGSQINSIQFFWFAIGFTILFFGYLHRLMVVSVFTVYYIGFFAFYRFLIFSLRFLKNRNETIHDRKNHSALGDDLK